ncbi:chloride channel protein [Sphingomonas sp. BIUV-7]|uniref:Chloride channel protein n=1 Tax=Sphingomonas natans TaxID=3063330 RepID=A0ABT8Y3J1_9SPHN|nr:chloride channel protein [Sphingomonas sp. BIUV-7]MDO6412881.1 chloride channel protein [Sphingomonas sp. BIUV-7]
MTVIRSRLFAPLLAGLRRRLRTSEAALIALALLLGSCAGLMTMAQAGIAHVMQRLLYGIGSDDRLSAQSEIDPIRLIALPIGGLALGAFVYLARRRRRAPIDVVEANALHGGAIPVRDSLTVSAQTILSNGAGASVGLEAAYAQMAGGLASVAGQWLRLRRNDLRILVGACAGAGVGAAFGAPLTGAFYAFEIVIGAYTPAAIAPVATAALAAALTVRALGLPAYLIVLPTADPILSSDYFLYAALGLVCALVGIFIMRAVTIMEAAVRRSPLPDIARPFVGGLLLVPLALVTPQILSAGHGALHLDLSIQLSLSFLATIFLFKIVASVISLGFGFRGGLFFASLFLGSITGQLFAGLVNLIPGASPVNGNDAALIGMAALAVAVVGGPLTMSMLVLEATHDFALTGTAITASLCASTLVRETFGFSFSTWRLHTRGETIRSARDVGWVKNLTAGRMMRRDTPMIEETASFAEFRRRFPLGSIRVVTAADDAGRYAGIIRVSAAFAADHEEDAPVAGIAQLEDVALSPEQDVSAIMRLFEESEADELAVVDPDLKLLGVVTEKYVRRRYTEEIEKAQRDLFGD